MNPLLKPLSTAVLLAALSATAQRPTPALATPATVAISPNAKTLAWTLRASEGSALHLTDVANPDPAKERLVTVGSATACTYASPVWSPDSSTLAFLSTCTKEGPAKTQQQIFLYTAATGETKQLTHLTGNLQQLAWSPDGKSIAFLFVENATRSAGALDAMKPWAGVIGEDGIEIQRVYLVDTATGDGGFITPADLHVYEFSLSPTPHTYNVTFVAAAPPGENTWWIAKLYVTEDFNVQTCKICQEGASGCKNACTQTLVKPNVVLDPTTVPGPLHGLQIAVPRFSPDGKQIAFIGGLMSDQGSTGGDVWVVPSNGKGAPADVTPAIDGTPTYIAWLDDNRIGIVEERRGHILLPDYDVAKRAYIDGSSIDLGEVTIAGGPIKNAISVASSSLALVKSSYNAAPEIYTVSQAGLKQITHLNDNAKLTYPKFESLEWQNDGFHVQGWLTYPKNYDPAKTYPLIVEVHGGPSASAGPRPSTQWSDLGYFVLAPNPRGSFGQGEAFVQANVKDFGHGDLRDILKGMDTVEAKVPIDKSREGLTGWSYGGFMTMFAVTQTHRFRAAVAGAGISDWQSYYGENSIDQWMVPFFGATVYDDPAVYAKSSAISYIKNVTTPTLVIVGDRDGECPAPQSFEFWHALRAVGVKTQLVIYPNEGHGFRDPEHIRDRAAREAKWFAETMPAK